MKKLRFGVGVYDGKNMSATKAYFFWQNMLKRCYCEKRLDDFPTYRQCSVCDEWKTFSEFRKWFDKNYIDGYELDKDIIKKGNKIYSPQFCSFLPQRLNALIINSKKARGDLPVGVSYHAGHKKYQATLHKDGKTVYIGYFNNIEDAFLAYKKAKETYIKKLAAEYYDRGEITHRVYDALMRYEVEITD